MLTIILEGPDGAGKSTLATKIEQVAISFVGEQHVRKVHADRPNPLEDYLAYFVDIITKACIDNVDILIFDRSWYSEIVYADTMRRTPTLDIEKVYSLDQCIKSHGDGFILFCDADDDVLVKRAFKERGEDFVNELQLRYAAASYRELFTAGSNSYPQLPVLTLRTDVGNGC